MAKHLVVVCCWEHGHETELYITKRQEQKLEKDIPKLKAICPTCRNSELGNMAIFIKEGETLFGSHKTYRCRHGHVTTVSPFTGGMLHTRFGPGDEDFVNIEGTIEELEEIIDTKEISCHHIRGNGRVCGCKLKASDDSTLSYPSPPGIKTRVRVGDLWDSAGIEPVRNGAYDRQGNYNATRSEVANRERLKKIRKNRNIDADRHPGKRIDKATKKKYSRRSKEEVKPDRLKGPR